MPDYLGIDTSNYTTSAAVFLSDRSVDSKRMLLPVKEGEKGLRQSDALFHHVRQLPELVRGLLAERDISAIGVSTRPRDIDGSYMPCFLAGETVADCLASACKIPVYKTSHQVGHILAALYSCKRLDLVFQKKPFIAFHVSGGTTDCLSVTPDDEKVIVCNEISSSSDLKAGQAVDRVGVALGLRFPCGAELEKLALKSTAAFRIKPSIRDGRPSFSGLENVCKKMIESGAENCDIALYCIKYIEVAIVGMAEHALRTAGELPMVFAGGVMSDSIIKNAVSRLFEAYFAEPALSADNACGTAVFAAIKDGSLSE